MDNDRLYWDKIEDSHYILYAQNEAYPLADVCWNEETGFYFFDSSVFGFSADYDVDELGVEYEDEVLECIKEDILAELSERIQCLSDLMRRVGAL